MICNKNMNHDRMFHDLDLNESHFTMCCSAMLCVLVLPEVNSHAVTATTQRTKEVLPFMLPQPKNDMN